MPAVRQATGNRQPQKSRLNALVTVVTLALVVVMAIAGCAGTPAPSATPSQPGEPAGDAFPVVVQHGLGATTIPSAPQRIVAIGGNDGDALFALGITPVAVLGGQTADGVPPWLAGRLDPASTIVLRSPGDPGLERIAALRPDLILAGAVPNIGDLYAKLAQIAPTVTYRHGPVADSWQDRLRLTARAVGRTAQADRLIADTERRIAELPDHNPGLRGKSVSIAWANQPGSLAVLGGDSNTTALLRALGLTVAPGLRDVQSNTLPNAASSLSTEQWSRLDADVVLVAASTPDLAEAVRDNPLVRALPAVSRGTFQAIDLSTVSALRVPSVLNVVWLLDQIRPTLVHAATS
ncbi:MAG TPA: iron-siderophore ABC transporter substrate-binding protein [Pseudonocardia sp.]|uniref:iron-siderophore ABC transporter substrate-binding protein n=1 Tax=Pseudonocardia sp. TaxID=60912 RepID=UPI002C88AF78|nr:iron-siderophore ABC transporter substrate-binding protein [Pseudonocardia sp.]HTF50025.1 iron-siderophore ABC transporter substrate-binding protein [Pseudonocardia sp.]